MFINHAQNYRDSDITIEPFNGNELHMMVKTMPSSYLSIYFTMAEAETIAFQINSVIQEMLTDEESADA
jgi:hypothetical protein